MIGGGGKGVFRQISSVSFEVKEAGPGVMIGGASIQGEKNLILLVQDSVAVGGEAGRSAAE